VHVTVKLFAGLREAAGASDLDEEFEGDTLTVSEFARRFADRMPMLKQQMETVAIAVNEEYTRRGDQPIHDGDVVALIPPIAGGAEVPHFLVTAEALDRDALRDLVRTDEAGAVVLFEGIVRNHHEGHQVLRLEYEAYAPMAEKQLAAVAAEVLREFGDREVYDIAAHHRTGPMGIGDVSLLVAVSSAHRKDGFDAALRAVDRIKETVPVWKKEYGPDGATWQEGVQPIPSPPVE
jgi:molybdopterin converting factor subunit 1